ncbi:MAG: hypothetical protein ABSG63_16660 [Spirochaetia bacterium]
MVITDVGKALRLRWKRDQGYLPMVSFDVGALCAKVAHLILPPGAPRIDVSFCENDTLACITKLPDGASIYIHVLLNEGTTPPQVSTAVKFITPKRSGAAKRRLLQRELRSGHGFISTSIPAYGESHVRRLERAGSRLALPGPGKPIALGSFIEILIPQGLSQLDRIKAALGEALWESLFQYPETLGEGLRIRPE